MRSVFECCLLDGRWSSKDSGSFETNDLVPDGYLRRVIKMQRCLMWYELSVNLTCI